MWCGKAGGGGATSRRNFRAPIRPATAAFPLTQRWVIIYLTQMVIGCFIHGMTTELEFPETLVEAVIYFADADRARRFLALVRWPDAVAGCPRCGVGDTVFMGARRLWRCRGCQKQFSVKVGTIFEDSPLGLDKWLPAVWCIVNAKNGISSCELARALGVTQKTAWFMLHRIRLAIQDGSLCDFAGNVEVDETYIGGKARNMHADRKREKIRGTLNTALTAVMGLLERTTSRRASRVVLKVVATNTTPELQGHVR